jgi:XTP/dITP diphosphohydrolase
MKLIIATKNKNKLREISEILEGSGVQVQSLIDHPELIMPEEDGNTFTANAHIKAEFISRRYPGDWVLADDSGLTVEALDGAPGIFSARYGGIQGDYRRNNEKLLAEMREIPANKRQAAFVCAMVLTGPNGFTKDVEGRCEGIIAFEPKGDGGFGYDPLFFIPAKGKTMAELASAEKHAISHRGLALAKIRQVLLDIINENK